MGRLIIKWDACKLAGLQLSVLSSINNLFILNNHFRYRDFVLFMFLCC